METGGTGWQRLVDLEGAVLVRAAGTGLSHTAALPRQPTAKGGHSPRLPGVLTPASPAVSRFLRA